MFISMISSALEGKNEILTTKGSNNNILPLHLKPEFLFFSASEEHLHKKIMSFENSFLIVVKINRRKF